MGGGRRSADRPQSGLRRRFRKRGGGGRQHHRRRGTEPERGRRSRPGCGLHRSIRRERRGAADHQWAVRRLPVRPLAEPGPGQSRDRLSPVRLLGRRRHLQPGAVRGLRGRGFGEPVRHRRSVHLPEHTARHRPERQLRAEPLPLGIPSAGRWRRPRLSGGQPVGWRLRRVGGRDRWRSRSPGREARRSARRLQRAANGRGRERGDCGGCPADCHRAGEAAHLADAAARAQARRETGRHRDGARGRGRCDRPVDLRAADPLAGTARSLLHQPRRGWTARLPAGRPALPAGDDLQQGDREEPRDHHGLARRPAPRLESAMERFPLARHPLARSYRPGSSAGPCSHSWSPAFRAAPGRSNT